MNFYKLITTKDFKKQQLFEEEEIVAEIDNPLTSLEYDIFKNTKKELSQKPLVIGYDNTVVLAQGAQDRFPLVSFAHYFLADTLLKDKQVSSEGNISKGKTFADLGCGAGFMGNYISKNFPSIMPYGKIIFSDLFAESINAAAVAYSINHEFSLDKSVIVHSPFGVQILGLHGENLDFRMGDAKITLQEEHIDVAVACPIYIPEVCEVFPQAYEVFGNVAKNAGADFYFAHSSLADKVVELAAAKTGAKLTDINSQKFPLVVQTVDSVHGGVINEEVLEKLANLGLMQNEFREGTLADRSLGGHYLRVSKFSYK